MKYTGNDVEKPGYDPSTPDDVCFVCKKEYMLMARVTAEDEAGNQKDVTICMVCLARQKLAGNTRPA